MQPDDVPTGPPSTPRISVIIPTYNRAELVLVAIESVLAQSFSDLEVVVVDDGSSDGTADAVVQISDKRVSFVELEHCGLLGAVRNAGLEKARGEYVAFLDSDDAWLPEKLEVQVAVLDQNPTVGLVCTNAEVIDAKGAEVGHRYLRSDQGSNGSVLSELLDCNFVVVSTAIIRRELIEKVGSFTDESLLRGVEDYDLWLRIALVSEVEYIPEALALYREHGSNMRHEVARRTYWLSLLRILDRLTEARRKLDQPLPGFDELIRSKAAARLLDLSRAERSEQNLPAALRTWLKAVRLDPPAVARIIYRSIRSRVLNGLRTQARASITRLRAFNG